MGKGWGIQRHCGCDDLGLDLCGKDKWEIYISNKISFDTLLCKEKKVNKLLIWSLVRNVITYILLLLPRCLIWIYAQMGKPAWFESLETRTEEIDLFWYSSSWSQGGCGGLKTTSHPHCPELTCHLPSQRHSLTAPSLSSTWEARWIPRSCFSSLWATKW